MLKIKLPEKITTTFLTINKNKFLVLNTSNNISFYFNIPFFIVLKKIKNEFILKIKNETEKNIVFLKKFGLLFSNFLNNLRLKKKKSIIFKGLGFKILLKNDILNFKIGYSHEINFKINLFLYSIKIYKNYLKILSNDKINLGNLIQKIINLKPADSYKGKGFFLKGTPFILKPIKK